MKIMLETITSFSKNYQNNTGDEMPMQSYMSSIDDSDNQLDSLYSNNDMPQAKEDLEKPISQSDIDKFMAERGGSSRKL